MSLDAAVRITHFCVHLCKLDFICKLCWSILSCCNASRCSAGGNLEWAVPETHYQWPEWPHHSLDALQGWGVIFSSTSICVYLKLCIFYYFHTKGFLPTLHVLCPQQAPGMRKWLITGISQSWGAWVGMQMERRSALCMKMVPLLWDQWMVRKETMDAW